MNIVQKNDILQYREELYMARRSDHTREELKNLILEESWKIIEKQGFEGLTARCIARK